jgi:TRAP-type mannitol/chloroaromatic compound transport system permease small subunit
LTKCHIRIDVFYQKFPIRLRTALDVIAVAVLAVVVIGLTYLGIEVAVRSFNLGSHSQSTLGTPLFIPQGIWSLGLTWFSFICIYLLVKNIRFWICGRKRLM